MQIRAGYSSGGMNTRIWQDRDVYLPLSHLGCLRHSSGDGHYGDLFLPGEILEALKKSEDISDSAIQKRDIILTTYL